VPSADPISKIRKQATKKPIAISESRPYLGCRCLMRLVPFLQLHVSQGFILYLEDCSVQRGPLTPKPIPPQYFQH